MVGGRRTERWEAEAERTGQEGCGEGRTGGDPGRRAGEEMRQRKRRGKKHPACALPPLPQC